MNDDMVKISDVKEAMGVSANSVKTLCTSPYINPFSKRKPVDLYSNRYVSTEDMQGISYGVQPITDTTLQGLYNQIKDNGYDVSINPFNYFGVLYTKPTGQYRLTDFEGYDKDAPNPAPNAFKKADMRFTVFGDDDAGFVYPINDEISEGSDSAIGFSEFYGGGSNLRKCIAFVNSNDEVCDWCSDSINFKTMFDTSTSTSDVYKLMEFVCPLDEHKEYGTPLSYYQFKTYDNKYIKIPKLDTVYDIADVVASGEFTTWKTAKVKIKATTVSGNIYLKVCNVVVSNRTYTESNNLWVSTRATSTAATYSRTSNTTTFIANSRSTSYRLTGTLIDSTPTTFYALPTAIKTYAYFEHIPNINGFNPTNLPTTYFKGEVEDNDITYDITITLTNSQLNGDVDFSYAGGLIVGYSWDTNNIIAGGGRNRWIEIENIYDNLWFGTGDVDISNAQGIPVYVNDELYTEDIVSIHGWLLYKYDAVNNVYRYWTVEGNELHINHTTHLDNLQQGIDENNYIVLGLATYSYIIRKVIIGLIID